MKEIGSLLLFFTFLGTGIAFPQGKGSKDEARESRMFIGTYTKKEGHVNGKAEGIYLMYRNLEDGTLRKEGTVAEVVNPSFVKESLDRNNLYAVSELGEKDASSGFLYSFEIKPDNSLERIGKIPTEGFAPCHVAVDGTGEYIFVSNYLGGVVAVYKRGSAGEAVPMQIIELENKKTAHSHSVTFSSDNKHFYVADLGNDRIWIYDFDDSTGEIKPNRNSFVKLADGAGPRHFTFSRDGKYAYSINELDSSVSVFQVLKNGGLEVVQTISTLPNDFSDPNSAADIHLHPSGDFLYASNRGHNSIVSYKIHQGKLRVLGFTPTSGETPRNFAIDSRGTFLYVANQDSDSIISFRINSSTGELRQVASKIEVKTPVCIEL